MRAGWDLEDGRNSLLCGMRKDLMKTGASCMKKDLMKTGANHPHLATGKAIAFPTKKTYLLDLRSS